MALEYVGGGWTAAVSRVLAAMRSQSLHRGIERSIVGSGVITEKFSSMNVKVGGVATKESSCPQVAMVSRKWIVLPFLMEIRLGNCQSEACDISWVVFLLEITCES